MTYPGRLLHPRPGGNPAAAKASAVLRFCAVLVAAAFLVPVHASGASAAAPQLGCAASATSLVAVTGSSGTLYAFHLTSREARTVSGAMSVDTNRGWFGIPLRGVKVARTGDGYGSPTLYARFPVPLRVTNSWLARIGNAQCYPPPVLPNADREWPYTPAKNAEIIQATIAQPYGRSDCSEPFAPVRALTIVEPEFDRRNAVFAGMAVIDVTIGVDGKPVEAGVAQSSKTPAFDDAAREAALKSTYSAAIAYCLPAPAHYMYKATLNP